MTSDPLAELLARAGGSSTGYVDWQKWTYEAEWLREHRTELLEALGGVKFQLNDPGVDRMTDALEERYGDLLLRVSLWSFPEASR